MKAAALTTEIRGQFAGHETFPLRLLWLKKVYEATRDGVPSGTFQEPDAIARFGVGRNMALAMRFWAVASGLFGEEERIIRPSTLGHRLLDQETGLDPYLEQAATIWFVHWQIASTQSMTTTAYFAFNALSAIEFDPAMLVEELAGQVALHGWRGTQTTLKRDVEVFLRSYARRGSAQNEDAAEPLLAELGLIREARLGGWYEFVRGPKPSLPSCVFIYALGQYWERQGGAMTLTAEQICYAPGSPGRVFKLDEDSVITRLMALKALTDGALDYSDTAGLRQVARHRPFDALSLLEADYGASSRYRTTV